MGEYIGASIQFGGQLKREYVEELISLLQDKGLTPDFDGDGQPLTPHQLSQKFGNWQINYGNLEELESFGCEHSLHYEYWSDSGPDWLASTVRYNPVEGRDELVGSDGDYYVPVSRIKREGFGRIMALIQRFEQPLPPLEIVP